MSNPSVLRRRKLLFLDLNGLLADIVSPLADCKADINIGRRASEFQKIFCLFISPVLFESYLITLVSFLCLCQFQPHVHVSCQNWINPIRKEPLTCKMAIILS